MVPLVSNSKKPGPPPFGLSPLHVAPDSNESANANSQTADTPAATAAESVSTKGNPLNKANNAILRHFDVPDAADALSDAK